MKRALSIMARQKAAAFDGADQATLEDARALHEEGVGVAPLPLPFIPPEAKN